MTRRKYLLPLKKMTLLVKGHQDETVIPTFANYPLPVAAAD